MKIKETFGIIGILSFAFFMMSVYFQWTHIIVASAYALGGVGLYSGFRIRGWLWDKLKIPAGLGGGILLILASYWTFELIVL